MDFIHRQRAVLVAYAFLEIPAFDVLHHHIAVAVDRGDGNDIGMRQLNMASGLVQKALLQLGIPSKAREQELDGHPSVQMQVLGLPYLGHSAFADLSRHSVLVDNGLVSMALYLIKRHPLPELLKSSQPERFRQLRTAHYVTLEEQAAFASASSCAPERRTARRPRRRIRKVVAVAMSQRAPIQSEVVE
jgi:hypothetical protein